MPPRQELVIRARPFVSEYMNASTNVVCAVETNICLKVLDVNYIPECKDHSPSAWSFDETGLSLV